MGGVSSVDDYQALDEPGDATVHDVPVADGDTWDATASSAGDDVADATADPPDTDEVVAASARDDAGQAKAATTLRAYRADWADCTAWCDRYALPALPAAPETVALYLAALADGGRKASTLQRRLSAISQAHQAAGHPTPTRDSVVRRTWASIRRAIGTAQAGKNPLVTDELRRLIAALPPRLLGAHDRALLLIGLDVGDVRRERDGLVVTLRHSKTDQEGAGRRVGLPRKRLNQLWPASTAQRRGGWRSGLPAGCEPLGRHRLCPGGRATTRRG